MRRKFTLLAGVAMVLMSACSTNRLAQNAKDDVYNTEITAKEQKSREDKKEPSYRTDEQLYGGNDYSYSDSDGDYDHEGEYATRIRRFQYNSPWRTYYDNWYSYNYDPWFERYYGYDRWYYRPGFSISLNWGYPWYYDNYYWGYYGAPYYSRYWGPYSYYRTYPYYGGYWGYYDRDYYYHRPRTYRSRPNRETGFDRDRYISPDRSRGNINTTRPERVSPSDGRRTDSRPSAPDRSSSRPSRPERSTTERSAPRESSAPSREYSRPERNSSPSRSSEGSSSRSSGSSGSSRPSRGNR